MSGIILNGPLALWEWTHQEYVKPAVVADWTAACEPSHGTRARTHVPCEWKRRAGRPTACGMAVLARSRVYPPGSAARSSSFCIGRAFLAWIIRTRDGPQPEEKAACSLHVEAPGGPTHG